MNITIFQIHCRARAVVTAIRHAVTTYFITEDTTQDSLTAPYKEFSTGPPIHV
jgi:hypothetical protein